VRPDADIEVQPLGASQLERALTRVVLDEDGAIVVDEDGIPILPE